MEKVEGIGGLFFRERIGTLGLAGTSMAASAKAVRADTAIAWTAS